MTRAGALYWRVVAPIANEVDTDDRGVDFRARLARVPEPVGVLCAAHWCQAEVRAGGLHQFLGNPVGVLAPEAAAALETLGLAGAATVVREALGFFGDPYPRDGDARERALEQWVEEHGPDAWDPFAALTDRLLDLLDTEAGGFEQAADRWAARLPRP